MMGLIAECGNHHFGDLAKAKEQIRLARESGAKWAKLQAIDTTEFRGGSMPREFYRQCDLGLDGYMECAAYGDQIGIPVFFSVFGSKYGVLRHSTAKPYKISGAQFQAFTKDELSYWNEQGFPVICSVPNIPEAVLYERRPHVSRFNLMYVTEYGVKEVNFGLIERFGEIFNRDIGFSDHSVGVSNCKTAVEHYGCRLVEKHFNPFGRQEFDGVPYRDCYHAATTSQLERLAACLNAEL